MNLAGIITTSAMLTGGVAFSLQETLGNLWGGIALQLDNTCRIGDWIRIEGVSGQVVGIRWRYTSIATNMGETVIIPNSQLIKNRVTVLGRRGDERIPWRRDVEFHVAYDVAAVARDRRGRRRRSRTRRSATSRVDPPLIVVCARLRRQRDSTTSSATGSPISPTTSWTDSQVRLHVAATLARHRMEIPLPHRVLIRRNAAADAGAARARARRPRARRSRGSSSSRR